MSGGVRDNPEVAFDLPLAPALVNNPRAVVLEIALTAAAGIDFVFLRPKTRFKLFSINRQPPPPIMWHTATSVSERSFQQRKDPCYTSVPLASASLSFVRQGKLSHITHPKLQDQPMRKSGELNCPTTDRGSLRPHPHPPPGSASLLHNSI